MYQYIPTYFDAQDAQERADVVLNMGEIIVPCGVFAPKPQWVECLVRVARVQIKILLKQLLHTQEMRRYLSLSVFQSVLFKLFHFP